MQFEIIKSVFLPVFLKYKLCLIKFYLLFLISPAYLEQPYQNVKNLSEQDKLKDRKTTESVVKAAFLQTRIHQIDAIKSVLKFQDYEKQYKIANKALEKIFEVVSSNKEVVENSNFIPGLGLPVNISVYEALGKILDNTAMFGEFRLKLPDISERIMNNHHDWLILMKWAISFSNSTGLFDDKTIKMINLLCQEMNLIPKEEHFINPYRKYDSKVLKENTNTAIKQKKPKLKKGPKMSKIKNTEF